MSFEENCKYSLLERIDMYAHDCGFPFKSILVSSTYFPESFNKVILSELNEALIRYGHQREDYVSDYIFTYDGTDVLKLMVYASDAKTRLVIFPKKMPFEVTIGKKLSEYDIIDRAKDIDNEAIEQLRFFARTKGLTNAINIEKIPFNKRLKDTSTKCLAFIDFWNKEYQLKAKEEEQRESLIHYTKLESIGEVKTMRGYGIGSAKKYERVNDILSVSERETILDSYDYMYKGYSYTDSSRDITHMNYMYQIGEHCYALVIEPYAGEGITKTLLHSTKEPMTQKRFEELVRYVLSIPYAELLRRDNIIRTNHTSLETFEDTLSVILRNVPKYNIQSNNLFKIRQKVKKNDVEYFVR